MLNNNRTTFVLIIGSFILAIIIACGLYLNGTCSHKKTYSYTDYMTAKKDYIDYEANNLKTTEERINALYDNDYLIISAGIKSLIDHPDPAATKPIIELLKDKKRTYKVVFDNNKDYSVEVLVRIGKPAIPFIIDEFRVILGQIPNENQIFVYSLEGTLSALTSLPMKYSSLMTPEDKKNSLQWWIDWWEQCKDLPEISWRKEAIKLHQKDLNSSNYPVRIKAIKTLRQLTGLKFSEVIVNTPAHQYPPIINRKDFSDYPTVDDLKKWQEWFDKYGEIDKWERWMGENYDYLYWSKDKGYFVVNEEAKAKGVSVNPETGQMILDDTNEPKPH